MKYEDSGVNIEKAGRIKREIARHIKSTWGRGVLSGMGHFGGLFELGSYHNPVLVSSIDGVGTKLIIAGMAGRFDTVGEDLVNHCVNDILVQGAEPLFFLDYIAAGSLDPSAVTGMVKGMSRACGENGCALIAGETAEMPGIYEEGCFDLAGCIVGVAEKDRIIDGSGIEPGDLVFGLPSSGLHTNGYSLARKVFFELLGLKVGTLVKELGCTVGQELLKVHPSYLKDVSYLRAALNIKGMAHITGGGIVGNLERILPAACDAAIKKGSWPVLPVFDFLCEKGKIDEGEMYGTFNMGLGMLWVCSREDAERVPDGPVPGFLIGEIEKGSGKVIMD